MRLIQTSEVCRFTEWNYSLQTGILEVTFCAWPWKTKWVNVTSWEGRVCYSTNGDELAWTAVWAFLDLWSQRRSAGFINATTQQTQSVSLDCFACAQQSNSFFLPSTSFSALCFAASLLPLLSEILKGSPRQAEPQSALCGRGKKERSDPGGSGYCGG